MCKYLTRSRSEEILKPFLALIGKLTQNTLTNANLFFYKYSYIVFDVGRENTLKSKWCLLSAHHEITDNFLL